ncbi:MAG: polysaccharide biosynthesis/export family protein [Gemmatimonadales bacterium]|jgi:protein involved in polysaccharide export with SLBB domain
MGSCLSSLCRRTAPIALALAAAACGGRAGAPLAELQPEPITTIRAGDIVLIEFWGQAEVSGERIVDDNGYIHLPLLRAVQVAGLSAEQIRERLTELYGQYYADPLVVVNVRLGVSVTGEVMSPRRYTVDPALNVLDLFGLAGGLTYEAKKDAIELNRGGRRYILDLDDALLYTQAEKLRLQSGDWIYVPRRFWTMQRTFTYATIGVLVISIANFFVN